MTHIHIWKCTGDVEEAKKFSNKYSMVNENFLKIRKIISDNSPPIRLQLYFNLEIDNNQEVTIKQYPESLEGIINSFVDRYF
jgi:dipeptidyl-peptidase-3